MPVGPQLHAQDIPQNTVVFRPILNGISEWGVNSPFNGRLVVENLAESCQRKEGYNGRFLKPSLINDSLLLKKTSDEDN